jgi:hypothetical protein
MDLIRIMERNGYERNAAIYVAIEMAKNPNLDNMAGLTVTGLTIHQFSAMAG